jgi:hypothetical protein
MRKARRFRVSDLVPVTEKEDSFVSDLARRVKAARDGGAWVGTRSMYRREISDPLDSPTNVTRIAFRPLPRYPRPMREGAFLDPKRRS